MAMNLRNPIQLLRGTGKAIESASSNDGTMFYDTEKGIFRVKRADGGFYDSVRAWEDVISVPTIYVDSVNGSDDNAGFSQSSPIKSIDKAVYFLMLMNSSVVPTIYLEPGTYTTSVSAFPKCNIQGSDKNSCIINIDKLEGRDSFFSISDCTLNFHSAGTGNACVTAYGGYYMIRNCVINTSETAKNLIYAGDSSYVFISNLDVYFDGYSYTHILISNYSSATVVKNVVIHGTVTVESTVRCGMNASFDIQSFTTDGSVTGSRYSVAASGIINVSGAGENAIPGTTAGTVSDGGLYK